MWPTLLCRGWATFPSMKVPPKRKGNATVQAAQPEIVTALNESPSEKEGKW